MNSPETTFTFPCGAVMKNRFMLAPMTNTQSYEDGQLSEDELHWLTKRAEGQFGMVMTCASHVQQVGKGFPGQLGIFSDDLIPGHKKLTRSIQDHESLAVIQLHHVGMRSPAELIQQEPVCPSANTEFGAREFSRDEIEKLRDDFIASARRAQQCGYDGVEVHGAHGYVISQFLSHEINKRTDSYGGSLENRSRLLFEIIHGIRDACGMKFVVGIRLSPEKFGMDLLEIKTICQQMIDEGKTDFLDISLWDSFKYPEDERYKHQSLLEHFVNLNYGNVGLTVAGNIKTAEDVMNVLKAGVNIVAVGRAAILHHDFPRKVLDDPGFAAVQLPVSEDYLRREGLGDRFINYLKRWPDFVKNIKI